MRLSIQYILIRLLIFFACLLLLWLIPPLRNNILILLVVATTVSMLISVFALNNMRNRISIDISEKLEERHRRHEEKRVDEVMEDSEDDSMLDEADQDAEIRADR